MSNRYSNEDAVKRIPNRFELVLVATQRVRELKRGHQPYVQTSNGAILTALEEIAEGHVGKERLARIGNREEMPRGRRR